jgi:uncharacterized protein (UPF0332 family)
MAAENRTSSYELFRDQRWRSCASRAYYATYADVTRCLVGIGVNMPAGRNNPSHASLPNLIGNNLTSLNLQARWRLVGLAHQMHQFRLIGDYMPIVTLIEDDARVSIGLMRQIFQMLEVIP